MLLPSRQVTRRQARFDRPIASSLAETGSCAASRRTREVRRPRSTAERSPLSACPSWESPCHRSSTRRSCHIARSTAARERARRPGRHRLAGQPSRRNGAATGAPPVAPRAPPVPPSAQHSSGYRGAGGRRSTIGTAPSGRHGSTSSSTSGRRPQAVIVCQSYRMDEPHLTSTSKNLRPYAADVESPKNVMTQ